jgi:hypothetical protein
MQASVAIKSARTYLNDINGTQWSDAILMPILQEAFGELIQDLDLNSIGVLKAQTSPISVPAGTTTLPGQPTNILEPISMQERVPGSDANFFQDMIKVNFLPEEDQVQDLIFWSWNGEVISLLGATSIKEVVLRYKGSLVSPQLLTDPIGVIYGERFLGPRIAAIAWDSIGRDSRKFNEIAERNKYKLIQRNVLQDQTPIRRRGYRSSRLVWPGESTGLISVTGGGGGPQVNVNFADGEVPSGAINGVNEAFVFLHVPNPALSLELYFNGQLLEQTFDYTLLLNTVTFINPPNPGDKIIGWYRY